MPTKIRKRFKRILVATLSLALGVMPVAPFNLAHAQSVTVAPNLMVILGNSYSMNREMDNVTYPSGPNGPIQTQCPSTISGNYTPAPVFSSDPGCGGSGSPFADHQYGNQSTSKLYIAKQVLYNLLGSSASNNINFGFATYRQAFGLQLATVSQLTNTFWPNIYPSGTSPQNPIPSSMQGWTTDQLTTYGNNPDNFAWVDWWPGWDNTQGHDFYLGSVSPSSNAAVNSFSKTSAGLPKSVQYPLGTKSQSGSINGSYFYGSGGLDLNPPVSGNTSSPDANFVLCKTYYNSQGNNWQGEYIATNSKNSPRMVVNSYPGLYNASTIQYIYLGSQQFDSNGNMTAASWQDKCSNGTSPRTIQQSSSLASDTFATSSSSIPAYFSYIPQVIDQVGNSSLGTFTGWSGAASYDPNTNQYTASYPSGPQSSTAMGNYNLSGAPYMGAFIDLPSPSGGYVDQRSFLENLVNPAYPQWDDSGLGYNTNQQTIVNNGQQQSISASDFNASYNPYQEPVYDSLMDAAAYFSAYKKQDPYDGCRTNAVLLIYDGHEDARYTVNPDGSITYADPSKAAAALAALGVKVNVVIISNNPGDIAQANAIAQAGGTNQAFQVSNANSLLTAIQTVFAGLQGAVVSASPAAPTQVSTGSMVYSAVSNNNYGSMQGHLYAYTINADGTLNTSSPAFDAANPSFQSNRGSLLWSDNPNSSGQQQITAWNQLPSSVFQSTIPSPSDISAYTVNPNYNNGQYLAGRSPGSYVGMMTSAAAKPVYVQPPNNPALLGTPGYAAFAQSLHQQAPFVLWSANDGFLYASNASTGALNWAYMPSPLLAQLKNYATFESGNPMNGGFTVADGLGADGSWHRFVFGTAQSGAIHYGFALNASGNPDTKVAVMMNNQTGATSPQASKPVMLWDSNGVAYAVYTTVATASNGKTTAQINVMSSQGAISSAALSFVPSSPLALDASSGTLYVGSTNGQVMSLNALSGYTAKAIAQSATVVGTMSNQNDPAQYVGYTQTSAGVFLWATGLKQIDVFQMGANGWALDWMTQDGGSSMNQQGTFSTDPGVSGNGPQFLPTNATITDASAVLNGALIVPVTQASSSGEAMCQASTASYYLFDLASGVFPQNKFTTPNQTPLTNNVLIGAGVAFSPVISYNAEQGGYSVYGSAQQNTKGQSLIQLQFTGQSKVPSGIVGWRPLYITQP